MGSGRRKRAKVEGDYRGKRTKKINENKCDVTRNIGRTGRENITENEK